MRTLVFLFSAGMVLCSAGSAQDTPQTQTPPVTSSTPHHQVGSGAQGKAGTPVPSGATASGQDNSGVSAPARSTAPAASGGVAGSAASSAVSSPEVQTPGGAISTITDSDLETQMQNALNKEPTLTGDSPHVSISGETVELSGTVGTGKEKTTATRIVQSYAGNKKLVNHLAIRGRNERSAPGPQSAANSEKEPPEGQPNPGSNPEPGRPAPATTPKPPIQ